jgi:WD40 repeat protein
VIFEEQSLGFARVQLSSGRTLLAHLAQPCCDVVNECDGGGPSADGSLFVTQTQRGMEVVELATGKVLALGHGRWKTLFTPDGRGLLSLDGPFLRREAIAGSRLLTQWRVELPRGSTYKLAVSVPTRLAAVACSGRVTLFRLDVATDSVAWKSLPAPDGFPESIAFSADGRFLAVGMSSREIVTWDLRSGRRMWQSGGRDACCEGTSLGFSPDGRWIASGGTGLSIRDAVTGRLVERWLANGSSGVFSVAFSPDGSILVSTGFDRTTAIWRMRLPPAR